LKYTSPVVTKRLVNTPTESESPAAMAASNAGTIAVSMKEDVAIIDWK
jgi:hypothetical protein